MSKKGLGVLGVVLVGLFIGAIILAEEKGPRKRMEREMPIEARAREAFSRLDKDDDGVLSFEEFSAPRRRIRERLGERMEAVRRRRAPERPGLARAVVLFKFLESLSPAQRKLLLEIAPPEKRENLEIIFRGLAEADELLRPGRAGRPVMEARKRRAAERKKLRARERPRRELLERERREHIEAGERKKQEAMEARERRQRERIEAAERKRDEEKEKAERKERGLRERKRREGEEAAERKERGLRERKRRREDDEREMRRRLEERERDEMRRESRLRELPSRLEGRPGPALMRGFPTRRETDQGPVPQKRRFLRDWDILENWQLMKDFNLFDEDVFNE